MLQQSFKRESGIGQVGELSDSHQDVLQDLSAEEAAAMTRIHARMDSFHETDRNEAVGIFYY